MCKHRTGSERLARVKLAPNLDRKKTVQLLVKLQMANAIVPYGTTQPPALNLYQSATSGSFTCHDCKVTCY